MGICVSLTSSKNRIKSQPNYNTAQVDISHYKVLAIIGAGGFSKVFKAIERSTGQNVAIKVVDKAKCKKYKSSLKALWTERSIMVQLNHPFLLPLLHCFQSFHECYFVLPFMAGNDLSHYSRFHRYLTEEEVRFYFCQLVLAVEYLHDTDIVHRDIKPRNMLLDSTGNMKLCDFGLAYQFTNQEEYLKSNAGTDSYCAPEMLNKTPYRFSVDIWCMGITLFELVCRKRPFSSNKHILQMHKSKSQIDFSRAEPCSASVKDLIIQLLSWETHDRLGCGFRGIQEIKEHSWFSSVDWEKVREKRIKPPYNPSKVKYKVSSDPTRKKKGKKKESVFSSLRACDQEQFKGLEFNVRKGNGTDQTLSLSKNYCKSPRLLRKFDNRRKIKFLCL